MPISTPLPREVLGQLQAVPTSLTALSSTDSQIFQMDISNPTAGAITFTLCDGQGSPVYLFNAFSLVAGGVISIDERQGLNLKSGVKWQAGGSGLTGSYVIRAK